MLDFFKSTVGKKYLMGISGAVWAGFVVTHMAGNLLIFAGADTYNAYGHMASAPPLIYVIEAVLIIAFLVHVIAAASVTIENKKAKGTTYAASAEGEKAVSLASRTMAFQGTLILFFIFYHLLTFKFGPYYYTTVDGVLMRDLARLMYEVFQNPWYVIWYLFCLFILGAHLKHGVGSIFQSLGLLMDARQQRLVKRVSIAYGVIVAAGFISQPIFILLKT